MPIPMVQKRITNAQSQPSAFTKADELHTRIRWVGLGISHYNKIENGQREASIKILDKLAQLYGITIDQIVHFEGDQPQEVSIEDKTSAEQMRLIQQLNEKEKTIVFEIIDSFLTKKKFKDFFQKNVAAL
ncbi:MAG: helix-turn-helix transcriptional regulator [Bacteroidota bacterium]